MLALAGPTASGKSAAALAVARALAPQRRVEIISVDSALVYRGMDIGTAKPSLPERAAVPHHLIDILDPAQAYSAAQFVADAQRLVQDIRARGRLPLVVGGSLCRPWRCTGNVPPRSGDPASGSRSQWPLSC